VEPDGPSYDDLYRAHRARVLRLCRLFLGDPDEAEDVGQEVFVKLFRASQRPHDSEMAWGPWLTRVTVHACRDRRRSRWWRRWWTVAGTLDEETVASTWRTPEGEVVSADQQRRIWRAFEQLAPRQREVFVLRHVEGWSTREVAEAIGVETGSVKRHLFRAIRHLRTALGEAS
jgi:RNA polymerase sigma-70 factor (ECF subfamily)